MRPVLVLTAASLIAAWSPVGAPRSGSVVVVRPTPGSVIQSPTLVVTVRAAEGSGVVTVRMFVDDVPVDPDTGVLTPSLTAGDVAVGPDERTVVVRGLAPGGHRLTVETLSTGDDVPEVIHVAFTFHPPAQRGPLFFLALALVVALLLLARRRLRPPAAPAES